MTADAWILVILGSAVIVVAGVGVLALIRFRQLCSVVGSFVCGMRARPEDRWHTGVAHYGVWEFSWWRGQSLSFRPARQWSRRGLQVTGHVTLEASGRPDLYLVRCRHEDETFELTLSESAYAGFASWLESSPPESRGNVV